MPRKPRVTIAQISDLHMNRKVSAAVTGMLRQILGKVAPDKKDDPEKKVGPDILIVSGDLANQPVPWQMKKAAKVLREIKQSCAPHCTIVIPGNHDFKFWGNLGLRRLTRIPFEIYFRNNGLEEGFWWRFRKSIKLALNALWWKGTEMKEPSTMELFADRPEWGLALFTVNSNSLTQMMAAGRVEANDLRDIYAMVDKAEKSPGFALRYRIIVVHHHPAPIADAPDNAIARIQDSFMIFYNAGLFVRELSRRGFNLVLHGHKHVAGFLRVVCEFPDQGRTVLPIAAAGTASHPAPDDTRGHHLNVVTIFDDDTAELKQWFFSATVEDEEQSHTYALETLKDVGARRHAIFMRLQGHCVSEIRKTEEITRSGYTDVQLQFKACRIVAANGLDRIPLALLEDRPSYLRGLEPAGGSGFDSIDVPKPSLRELNGHYCFKQFRHSDDGLFTYGYRYRLMNGHVLTAQEFVRHYGTTLKSEYASVMCDRACDSLTLTVVFPEGYSLAGLEFDVLAEYVSAPLRGVDDLRLVRSEASAHDEETKRIQGGLQQEADRCVLTCRQPVPGMIYKILWKFRELKEETEAPLALTAKIAAGCKKMLSFDLECAEYGQASARLQGLADDIKKELNTEEEFVVHVMVFDEETNRLRHACSNTGPLLAADFISGEGCAGFAFEKIRPFLYHPKKDSIGYFIHPSEWTNPKELIEPVVLISLPWIHDVKQPGDPRKLVLGVVNIYSSLDTTALLNLFDLSEDQVLPIVQKINGFANYAAGSLLEV